MERQPESRARPGGGRLGAAGARPGAEGPAVSAFGVILATAILVILIVIEFPIAFAFAAASVTLAAVTGRDLALVLPTAFWQTGGFALLALPLFIIAGTVMPQRPDFRPSGRGR